MNQEFKIKVMGIPPGRYSLEAVKIFTVYETEEEARESMMLIRAGALVLEINYLGVVLETSDGEVIQRTMHGSTPFRTVLRPPTSE